jgi:hypothetical protein
MSSNFTSVLKIPLWYNLPDSLQGYSDPPPVLETGKTGFREICWNTKSITPFFPRYGGFQPADHEEKVFSHKAHELLGLV